MTQIHVNLWQHITQVIPEQDLPWPHQTMMCAHVFENYHERSKSLRLTQHGLVFLKTIYNHYEFPLDDHVITMLQKPWFILGLQRHMKSPYHVDMKCLTVFDREVALEIQICGGQVFDWAQSFLK